MDAQPRTLIVLSLLLCGSVYPAFAQQRRPVPRPAPQRAAPSPPQTSSTDPNSAVYDRAWDVWYQVRHESSTSTSGIGASLATKVGESRSMMWRAVGELDLSHFDGFTETGLLGGVRAGFKGHRELAPFIGFLAGLEHCCGSTDPAIQPEAGIDLGVSNRFLVRAQAGVRTVFFGGDAFSALIMRFGVVMPLK